MVEASSSTQSMSEMNVEHPPLRPRSPDAQYLPTPARDDRSGASVGGIVLLGALIGLGAVVAAQWPEIQRYLKMKRM